jgi:glutathione S-transferase
MKPIKIWGRANSGNVKKVLIVADELNIPYERIDAGMQYGIVDTPEYRKLNPNGKVPTIEDGDLILWESNSISRYFAMKYGGEGIYPKDPAVRAGIDRWLDWILTTLIAVDVPVFSGTIRTPVEKHDKTAIAANVKKLADVLQIPESHLAGKQWLEGGAASLADLLMGVFVYRYLKNTFIDRPAHPNLEAWIERLMQRPSYKKHVVQPLT